MVAQIAQHRCNHATRASNVALPVQHESSAGNEGGGADGMAPTAQHESSAGDEGSASDQVGQQLVAAAAVVQAHVLRVYALRVVSRRRRAAALFVGESSVGSRGARV